ncbi:MAG: SIS domain-containing protein [Promethearchaeota archaeon]
MNTVATFSIENYNKMHSQIKSNLFFQEISSQPYILQNTFEIYKKNNFESSYQTLTKLLKLDNEICLKFGKNINKVIFVGIGTSYYAALIAKYYFHSQIKPILNNNIQPSLQPSSSTKSIPLLSKIKKISLEKNTSLNFMFKLANLKSFWIDIADAGEFQYFYNFNQNNRNVLLIFISQSGESGEIIETIKKLKINNFPKSNIWAITNTENSTLDKNASHTLYLYAGKENTVTNKTYICTLFVINILSAILKSFIEISLNPKLSFSSTNNQQKITNNITSIKKNILSNNLAFIKNQMNNCIEDIKNKLKNWDDLAQNFIKFLFNFNEHKNNSFLNKKKLNFINYLSRGTGLATAGQGALNTKEVAKIYAESLSLSMFRHGCIEIIDHNYICVIISNSNEDRDYIIKIIENITEKWSDGKTILISNSKKQIEKIKNTYNNTSNNNNLNIMTVLINVQNKFLSPLAEIIPLQILFFTLAELQGLEAGSFKYSSKITK